MQSSTVDEETSDPARQAKTPLEFLRSFSPEVKDAFNEVKQTLRTRATVYDHLTNLEPFARTKPIVRRSSVNTTAGSLRKPSGHERVTGHLLRALKNEAKKVISTDQRDKIPDINIHILKKPGMHTRTPENNVQKETHSRRFSHVKSSKERNNKHHRQTPPFVRKLGEKHRVSTNFTERMSQSPGPTRGLSIVHIDGKVARATIKTWKIQVPGNPYRMDSHLGITELQETLRSVRKLQRSTLPHAGPNMIKTEKVQLGNKLIRVPVLNFQQREMAQKFKGHRNDPDNVAGITNHPGNEDPNCIRKEGLSPAEKQQLAANRRDHRVQQDKKWDVIARTRDLNYKESKLSLQRRKLDYMQQDITKVDEEMDSLIRQSEITAKNLEMQLKTLDQVSITAIHEANDIQMQRDLTRKQSDEVEKTNNLLQCQSIRLQEKIQLVNRFVNVIMGVIPEKVKSAIFKQYRDGLLPNYFKANNLIYKENQAVADGSAEVKECKSSDDESDVDIWNDAESNVLYRFERSIVPPVPFTSAEKIFPFLQNLYTRSKEACHNTGKLRFESRHLQKKIGAESLSAAAENNIIRLDCEQIENEIRDFESDIASLRLDNARYETGVFRRDTFRKPIDLLKQKIFETYRRNFDSSEQSILIMLQRMKDRVREIINKFQDIPPEYVKKCYHLADKDAAMQKFVTDETIQRTQHEVPLSPELREASDDSEPNDLEPSPDGSETDWIQANLRAMTETDFDGGSYSAHQHVSRVNNLSGQESSDKLQEISPEKVQNELCKKPSPFISLKAHRYNSSPDFAEEDVHLITDALTVTLSAELAACAVSWLPAALNVGQRNTGIAPENNSMKHIATAETPVQKSRSYPELTLEETAKDEAIKQFFESYDEAMPALEVLKDKKDVNTDKPETVIRASEQREGSVDHEESKASSYIPNRAQ